MSPRRAELPAWVPWLLGALVVTVAVWPWPLHPLSTLGAPDIEADNHLWMLWRAVQRAGGHEGVFLNWPVGEGRPLMDVVHLPLALLGMSADPCLGYGLVATVDMALAAAGGWWVAREAGASRQGALVGLVVLGSAPVLMGLVVHGLAEDWPVGLYALHVAAMLRTGRTGSWRSALAAGLFLAGYALAGWYAALFAALASPAVLLWVWRVHRPDRRAWIAMLLAGAGAVLVVAPELARFWSQEDLGEVMGRWTPAVDFQAGWRTGDPAPPPPWGADPINLVLPALFDQPVPRSVYVGLATLVLAGVGAWRRPAARWALVGAGTLCFLALGHHLLLAGRPWVASAPLPGPGALLALLVPPLRSVAGWYRAVAPAMVFFAAAAALGADAALERRRPSWALAVAALVLVDATLLGAVVWPKPVYDPRPPAALAEVPGSGTMLLLPVDRGQTAWEPHAPRLYQRWQPWLRRPLVESYERDEVLGTRDFLRWAVWACDGPRHPSVIMPLRHKLTADQSRRATAQLARDGVEVVAALPWRLRDPEHCAEALGRALGAPAGESDEVIWWTLPSGR